MYAPSVVFCNALVPGCKFVVKAQVLAGGRGKGHWESGMQGGVKLAKKYVFDRVPVFIV